MITEEKEIELEIDNLRKVLEESKHENTKEALKEFKNLWFRAVEARTNLNVFYELLKRDKVKIYNL